MKIELFDFSLPDKLIAQQPKDIRSNSRLLVYYKDKDLIVDSFTKNLVDFLDPSCHLVFNDSKVIPARIKIKRDEKNGELLITKIIDKNNIEAITDKAKKYKKGTKIILPDGTTAITTKEIDHIKRIFSIENDSFNNSISNFNSNFSIEYFEKYGEIPLPPYIKRNVTEENDKIRYQTVFCKEYGSIAAPTAGLHFDNYIFESLKIKNIDYNFITLNVGLGTFLQMRVENIEDHKIHSEDFFISDNEANKINDAIKKNKKIIPIGTTSLRTLESNFSNNQIVSGLSKSSLYIYPPYQFKVAKGLFTNFHTPKSTLIVLVAAMVGVEKILEIYKYAIEKEYRFFSYGDAMLII